MDYNSYNKYFSPKNPLMQIIGGFIIACGIPLFFVGRGGSMMAVVVIAIGLCVFIFSRDSRPSDAEIDQAVATRIKDIDDLAKRGIDIRERLIKAFPPIIFEAYDFSGINDGSEEFRVQRGRDSKYRSNKYTAAEMLFAQEKLHIFMMQFSLTEENEHQEYFDSRYTDLDSAVLEHREHNFVISSGKKTEEVKLEYESIVIRDNNGVVVFDMPVHDGADVDKAVETVNRLIEGKKNGTMDF